MTNEARNISVSIMSTPQKPALTIQAASVFVKQVVVRRCRYRGKRL